MLLVLLSFYVHYGLLNCEEIVKAKFNESSLVEHHGRVLLQVNSLLQDLAQKARKLAAFNANSYENNPRREEFVYKKNSSDLRSEISGTDQSNQNLKNTIEPPPVTLPSSHFVRLVSQDHFPDSSPSVMPPDPTELVNNPGENTELHYPEHQLIPINSIYPGQLPPGIFSENSSSHYVANYSNLPRIFRPREQIIYKQQSFINHFHIMPFPPVYAVPLSSPSIYVTEYTPLPNSILTTTIRTPTMGKNAKIWLKEIAPYTRRKKTKKVSEDQSRPYHMGTTMPIPPTAQLFQTDEYGILHVVVAKFTVRPGTIQEEPHKNWMTTTLGDVLYGKIKVQKPSTQTPEQRHQDLMEQLEEGYLMVFVIELFRLIAVKDKQEVQEVLSPMRKIYDSLSENGRLDWVDDPLRIFIEKLSNVASSGGDGISLMRTYSSMMFHSLLRRKEVLSTEVNSVIDQAELFYSDEEGKRLLRSLTEFEDYPSTAKASYWICQSLIENILQPFRRPSVARSRDRLLDSVNRALRRRFPLLTRERIWPKVGTNPSKRKRKHHHKKKRKRKIHFKPEYYKKQYT